MTREWRIAVCRVWHQKDWMPCRMRPETEIDRAMCGSNRFMCFVGDSQMRHAYNGVTSLFKGSLEWHGAAGAKKTDKSVMQVLYS